MMYDNVNVHLDRAQVFFSGPGCLTVCIAVIQIARLKPIILCSPTHFYKVSYGTVGIPY